MATIIDTNIVTKYLANTKIASQVLEGVDFDKKLDDKLLAELEAKEVPIEEDILAKIQAKIDEVANTLKTLPVVEEDKSFAEYLELPAILNTKNTNLNRLIETENGKTILMVKPDENDSNVKLYELDEENVALNLIFEIPSIFEEDDIRLYDDFERIDIIWNFKEEKFQIFWVSVFDKKVRTAFVNDGKYEDIQIISNNASDRYGQLRASMNEAGDIVVFTTAKNSDGNYYGIVVSKERSLNSWQTTDLLDVAKDANGKGINDKGAYGRVQVVGEDFFYAYTNDTNRIYVVRIQNSDNQLITSSVTENVKATDIVIQQYKQYDEASNTTDYYIVLTSNEQIPRVVKVQNDLEISTLDKLPAAGTKTLPYIFTKDGNTVLFNKFTKNFGEQWIENKIGKSYGTLDLENQKFVLIAVKSGTDVVNNVLVNVDEVIKFNNPLRIR